MATAVITALNPHLQARLLRIEADPQLKSRIVECVATYNRALAYVMSASVVFAIAFYAATKV
ncbi:hypothetical protein MRBLMR1_004844 [Neorhizobium sp. LMR1-1-1.1]